MQYSAIMTMLGAALALGSPLVTKADIEACLTGAGVPIDTKGSEGWKRDVAPFNVRIPYTPVAIAVVQNTKHIVESVNCGRKLGIKVSAKSGGHSYANLGFGGQDGQLIVQLDRMHDVKVNDRNYAEVDPGTRLGHLYLELNKAGRAVSQGTCGGVGMGHYLHGGFGFSSHKHGLAVDAIYKLEVVLANGKVVTASEHENQDLFWAMKGAGSNFGIASKFYLRTYSVPQKVTTFGITLNWDKASAIKGINWAEDYAKDEAPENINFRIADYGKGNPSLEGLFYGNENEARKVVEPIVAKLGPKAVLSSLNQTTWIDAVVKYSNVGIQELDYTTPSPQENFYAKSLALKTIKGKPTENFVNYWFDVMNNHTEHFWFFQLDLHGGKNSAISKIKNSETAYPHRDKLWLIQFYDRQDNLTIPFATGSTDATEYLDAWVKTTQSPLKDNQWGAYVNYVDSDLTREESQKLYYGTNLKKLQQLKKKYDPEELFYSTHSIRPYGTKWGTASIDSDAVEEPAE